jgi:phage repressor protein C with HTH and peptisase S24 domain
VGVRLSNPQVNHRRYLARMDVHDLRREVIRRLIDSRFGGNQAEFARAAAKRPSYVTRMLETDPDKAVKRIGEELAREFEANPALGLVDGELVNPAPVQRRVAASASSTALTKRAAKGDFNIAHFDTGGAMGSGVLLRDQPGVIQSWRVSTEWIQKNVRGYSSTQNLCIVTGFGDSMRPLFNPGDPLLVDTGVIDVTFDAIYFFRVGDEGFIKRLQRIPGEGMVAISENKAYRDWTIKEEMDFQVFGRVLKVWCSQDF